MTLLVRSLMGKQEVRDKREIMAGVTFCALHSLIYHLICVHGVFSLGSGPLGPAYSI